MALIHFPIALRAADTQDVMGTTRTDEHGRFHFADLAPGKYGLWISSDKPTVEFKVRQGRDLDLHLRWAAWPSGEVCL